LLKLGVAQTPASRQSCDRERLGGMLTRYLSAVVAHDSKMLPLDANVRFTENTVETPGRGVVEGGVRPGCIPAVDVRQGLAGAHAILLEKGAPVQFRARLKLASGRISEIDTTVVRNQAEGMIFRRSVKGR
jgi:hypothetical protein